MSEKHLPIIGGGYDRIVCDLDGTAWVPERTCERFWTGAEMLCSSCAHQLNSKTARYCPNCGARVIGGNE